MNKPLVWLALALVAGLGWFWFASRLPRPLNLPPAATGPWVAFGDSLTAGVGAEAGQDYPAVLAQRLGVPVQNLGAPGETSADGVRRLDRVLALQPRVVLLCFGGNDSLQSVPPEETLANLGRMIDALHEAGAFVVLIGIRSASVLDRHHRPLRRLAREKRVLYVPDFLRGILGRPALMADYVHPNGAGYAVFADRLAEILQPLLPQLAPAAAN